MELYEALKNRRSVAKLKSDPVPREVIEKILDGAIWAPNHKRTEPWKFYVFTGDSRQKLAEAVLEDFRRDHENDAGDAWKAKGQKAADRMVAAPLTIVVTSDGSDDPVIDIENYAATCVAVEHILLGIHAEGLGATWRTGDAAYTAPSNAINELIDAPQNTRLVAFVITGYPDGETKGSQRVPAAEKTVWFE